MTAGPVEAPAPVSPVDQAPVELVVRVIGTPAKQGSKDFKGLRRGKPILVESDEKLPAWRDAVVIAARSAIVAHGSWIMLTGPCIIDAIVFLPRPRSVTREWPVGMQDGDADKYLRALSDAITLAGVWVDDKLAVRERIEKRYADGRPPGALVVVRPAEASLL